MPFSREVRNRILNRDKRRSTLSGKTDNLHVAHINHDKSNPLYDHESNGRTLTVAEHFWDHVNRHGTEQLGLTESQNNWAIWRLWKTFWGID